MIGGDFKANINGINHYRKFGYKGIQCIFINAHYFYYTDRYVYIVDINIYIYIKYDNLYIGKLSSSNEFLEDSLSPDWITVKYKYDMI